MKPSLESLQSFSERLTLARSRLLRHEPLLGYMTLELPTHVLDGEDELTTTAATDGSRYFYNYHWCRQLNDAELVFVVAHEVAHVLFLHVFRRSDRDAVVWNAACDFAVNDMLLRSCAKGGSLCGIAAMPSKNDPETGRPQRIGLWDKRFSNWTAEVIYDELERGDQQTGLNWDQMLEPAAGAKSVTAETKARAAVAKALIRGQEHRQRHGGQPGCFERIAEAGLGSTVPWQQRLRRHALAWGFDTISWSRPNPKFRPHGFYFPRHRGYELPNLLVAFDTSGSVSERFLGQMVAELNELLLLARNTVIRVISCDATVRVLGDFHAGRRLDLQHQTLHGGGGTDFRPVFDYAQTEKRFRQLIYLTDACGTFPAAPFPDLSTLWLIPHDSPVRPPFGEVIPLPISVNQT